jgi:hypothetical protein
VCSPSIFTLPGALAWVWGNVPNTRWNFIFGELGIGCWLLVIGYWLFVIWKNTYPCIRDFPVVNQGNWEEINLFFIVNHFMMPKFFA